MAEPLEQNQLAEPVPQESPSLKQRALRGSLWTIASYGISQVLRLGGNLVLSRLLFPEAFGLMALVQAFIIGLEMFSDVGVYSSIIQNKRGDDPDFLNTAWTLQVLRGVGLWLCACAIAWPAGHFYNEPKLTQLLPFASLVSAIGGLNSTKLATANRRLALGRVTLIDLSSYVINLAVMIVWGLIAPSVWALVGGSLISSVIRMILSHTVLEGETNRFHWEPEAFRELQKFGQWIFFSTALTFVAGQGDRLILGRLLDVRFLGVYGIAVMISRAVSDAIQQTAHRVLFPSYSELIRDRPERLYRTVRRCRLMMIVASWAGSLFLIIFGKPLIHLLYDNRYEDAGWMIQVIALGGLVGVLGLTYDNILIAKGKTFTNAILLAIQIALQIPAMFLGYHWGGQKGVIIGLTCVEWLLYPPNAIIMASISLWQPEVDLPVLALGTGVGMLFFFNFFN